MIEASDRADSGEAEPSSRRGFRSAVALPVSWGEVVEVAKIGTTFDDNEILEDPQPFHFGF